MQKLQKLLVLNISFDSFLINCCLCCKSKACNTKLYQSFQKRANTLDERQGDKHPPTNCYEWSREDMVEKGAFVYICLFFFLLFFLTKACYRHFGKLQKIEHKLTVREYNSVIFNKKGQAMSTISLQKLTCYKRHKWHMSSRGFEEVC